MAAAGKVLVLGGAGIFGSRIARRLDASGIATVLATRSRAGIVLAGQLQHSTGVQVDASNTSSLSALLRDMERDRAGTGTEGCHQTVINCAGPWQGSGYDVPLTVAACGAHYVDLADATDYVCGFADAIGPSAAANGVTAIAGASSVPGLSSAVVRELARSMARVDAIRISINPGNQTPRGLATVRSILSQCGRAYPCLRDGRLQTVYGWQSTHRRTISAEIGPRWLSAINVPDLQLLPRRYPSAKTVEFSAGLELGILHLGMVALSGLTRMGLVPDWSAYARPLKAMSEWFVSFGSTVGGMDVQVAGASVTDLAPIRKTWRIVAQRNGPEIPCTAAVVLAETLATEPSSLPRGAMPCIELFTVDRFMQSLRAFPGITCETSEQAGPW